MAGETETQGWRFMGSAFRQQEAFGSGYAEQRPHVLAELLRGALRFLQEQCVAFAVL